MGLLPLLLLLHLPNQLHQLLNGEQDTAAIDQITHRRMKVMTGRLRKSTEPGRINLPKKIEQGLTRGSGKKLPQNLKIESLLPVQGNRPQPAQPLKACQLF